MNTIRDKSLKVATEKAAGNKVTSCVRLNRVWILGVE